MSSFAWKTSFEYIHSIFRMEFVPFTLKWVSFLLIVLHGYKSMLSYTPCWLPGHCLWCQVFLVWMRKQYPTETFGNIHKPCPFSYSLSLYLTLLAFMTEKEDRAGHHKRVVILVLWCPLCIGVPLMRQACWSEIVEGGLSSIKTHCGVSRVGHNPAVGTPKAWRGNNGPPMSLHGKDSDITAITYATAWTKLWKVVSELKVQLKEAIML